MVVGSFRIVLGLGVLAAAAGCGAPPATAARMNVFDLKIVSVCDTRAGPIALMGPPVDVCAVANDSTWVIKGEVRSVSPDQSEIFPSHQFCANEVRIGRTETLKGDLGADEVVCWAGIGRTGWIDTGDLATAKGYFFLRQVEGKCVVKGTGVYRSADPARLEHAWYPQGLDESALRQDVASTLTGTCAGATPIPAR